MFIEFSGFDWDKGNQAKNLHKHGVSSLEAEESFRGRCFVYPDERHSTDTEKRYVLFGESKQGKHFFIAFTLRGKKVRIISARPMGQKERNWYEEEKKKTSF